MAGVSRIPTLEPALVGHKLFGLGFDDDVDATVHNDIDQGPTQIWSADVDNNALGTQVFASLWDKRTPVIGTDAQDFQIPVAASGHLIALIPYGGLFYNGLSWACTTDKGTAGNTSPATPPDLRVVTSAGVLRDIGAELAIPEELGQGEAQVTTFPSTLGTKQTWDEDADQNLRVASSSAVTLYALYIDNRRNSASSWLKIYDAASPVVGTDAPHLIARAYKGRELLMIFPRGVALGTALRYAVVASGGTSGTTAPAEAVSIMLWY